VCGDERPKQYVPLLGDRTLLRQTLDCIGLVIPVRQTGVVTVRRHAAYLQGNGLGGATPRLLVQPGDRGTAAAILLAAHWVCCEEPGATMAVFPSDHYVRAEAAFMAHVAEVAAWVDRHQDRLVLLGARATAAEVEYGWIEVGRPLAAAPEGRISEVRRFWEKPSTEHAQQCLSAGCLWNTFVLVGKAAAFLDAGRQALPEMEARLDRVSPLLGTDDEGWALHQAYALMPPASFSRAVLEPCPPSLAVSHLPDVTWSDLGSPRRVFELLKCLPRPPLWAANDEIRRWRDAKRVAAS
jgi:mannose-1-phosphate guanylyltransferase